MKNSRQAPPPHIIDKLREDVKSGKLTREGLARELSLRTKQQLFADIYLSGETDFEKAATARLAYPDCSPESAAQMGNQNFQHPCIKAYMDILWVNEGMGRTALDVELMRIVKDRNPMTANAQVKAIELAYKVTGQLENTLSITIAPKFDLSKLTDEEYAQFKALTLKAQNGISDANTDTSGGLP